MQELITIKQLPIIEEKLQNMKIQIEKEVNGALAMECTEDTYKVVKAKRAELNKQFGDVEKNRKEVKNKILAPYNAFENVYKECVSDLFKKADKELSTKISIVETMLKDSKKNEVERYFNELCSANAINFVDFSQSQINVTMSASLKSLKEQSKSFIDKITDDLKLISTQDYGDEIIYEYKQSLNVSNAITTVVSRHKAIEEAKEVEKEEPETLNNTEEESDKSLSAPIKEEEKLTLAFKVTATLPQLKALKEFLERGNYDYD